MPWAGIRQNRGGKGTSLREAVSRHFWHTLLGLLTAVVTYLYTQQLFWWMLPITLGLMLSIPISVLTSRESTGLSAKKHNFFVIPEEIDVPQIMRKEEKYAELLNRDENLPQGVELIITDRLMNALHIYMLEVNGPAPEISQQVLETAQIKLENYINHRREMDLTRDEEIALLYNPEILEKRQFHCFFSNKAAACSKGRQDEENATAGTETDDRVKRKPLPAQKNDRTKRTKIPQSESGEISGAAGGSEVSENELFLKLCDNWPVGRGKFITGKLGNIYPLRMFVSLQFRQILRSTFGKISLQGN